VKETQADTHVWAWIQVAHTSESEGRAADAGWRMLRVGGWMRAVLPCGKTRGDSGVGPWNEAGLRLEKKGRTEALDKKACDSIHETERMQGVMLSDSRLCKG
jgi:hypothetical protein